MYCRLCGYKLSTEVPDECDFCGSVSVLKLPTSSQLSKYYQDYNENYEGGHAGGGNLIRYANKYLQIINKNVKGGELIDIGSSNNPFPNIACQAGFYVTVMDFIKPANLREFNTLHLKNILRNDLESKWMKYS